jgi:cold-inducible RNA-binding protein
MNAKLYVGNLSFNTNAEDLRAAFEAFGDVTDVMLPTDRETGRPRGFAFVTFATEEAARTATEKMNGAELGGRPISVNEAREKEPGTTHAGGRVYTSPPRRAGAFNQRFKRRGGR